MVFHSHANRTTIGIWGGEENEKQIRYEKPTLNVRKSDCERPMNN